MNHPVFAVSLMAITITAGVLNAQESTFDAYSNAGVEAYNVKKDYANAKRLFQLAVDAGSKSRGPTHIAVLESRLNLALAQIRLKEYNAAIDNTKIVYQALSSPKTQAERNEAVRAAKLMGEAFSYFGKVKDCEAILEWAIAVEKQGRKDEGEIIGLKLWMEDAKLEQKDYPAARKIIEEVIEYRSRKNGAADATTRWAIDELGRLETLAGNHAAAEAYYAKLIRAEDERVPPDRLRIASLLKKQIEVYVALEKPELAIQSAQRVKEIYESGGKDSAEDAIAAAVRLIRLYSGRRDFGKVDEIITASLAKYEKLLGKDDAKLVDLYEWQGSNAEEQEKWDAAAIAFSRALQLRRTVSPVDRPGLCYSLTRLSVVESKREHSDEVEKLMREVVEIRREQDLDDDLATAVARLADFYQRQGNILAAEKLFVETLAEREQKLGAKSPRLTIFLNSLAGLYSAQGKYDMAEKLLQRSLENREASLGKSHLDVAQSLEDLGDFYEFLSRYAESEAMHRRALVIREQLAGAATNLIASSLGSVAWELMRLDRDLEAEPLARRAVTIYEGRGETKSESYANAANVLGCALKTKKEYEEAEKYLRTALSVYEARNDQAGTATLLNNIALLSQALGKFEQARRDWERAIPIQEKELDKEALNATTKLSRVTSLVRSMTNLAGLQRSLGDVLAAANLYDRALAIAEKDLEPTHKQVTDILASLSSLRQSFGAFADAEALLTKRGEFVLKRHGPDSFEYAYHKASLADLQSAQGKYRDAKKLRLECLATVESTVTDQGGDLTWLYLDLADSCYELDQLNEAQRWVLKGLKNLKPRAVPTAIRCYSLIVSIGLMQGKFKGAEDNVQKIAGMVQEFYREPTSPYGAPRSQQIQLNEYQGDWPSAKSLRLEALELDDRIYGPGSYSSSIERRLIGRCCIELKQYDEAQQALNRSIEDLTKIVGVNHFQTALSRLDRAELNLELGKLEEAQAECAASLEVIRTQFGDSSSQALFGLAISARISAKLKQEDAETKALAVVKGMQDLYGQEHWLTARSLAELGEIRIALGKLPEAEEPLQQSLKLRRPVLVKSHPDMQENVAVLVELLEKLNRVADADALRSQLVKQ